MKTIIFWVSWKLMSCSPRWTFAYLRKDVVGQVELEKVCAAADDDVLGGRVQFHDAPLDLVRGFTRSRHEDLPDAVGTVLVQITFHEIWRQKETGKPVTNGHYHRRRNVGQREGRANIYQVESSEWSHGPQTLSQFLITADWKFEVVNSNRKPSHQLPAPPRQWRGCNGPKTSCLLSSGPRAFYNTRRNKKHSSPRLRANFSRSLEAPKTVRIIMNEQHKEEQTVDSRRIPRNCRLRRRPRKRATRGK